MFTPEFFAHNRNKLFSQLPENSIAFVVSSDELPRNGDQTFRYRQNSDLFYLTGIEQEQSILMLTNAHPDNSKHQILFIRRASELEQIWEGHKLTQKQANKISGVQNVMFIDQLESVLSDLMFYAQNVFISLNENLKYQRFYNDADFRFLEKLRYQFPLHNYQRLSPILINQRLIKQEQEIEAIRHAIKITGNAFQRLLKFIKPNVTENEIEAEITHEFIRSGAYSHSFLPIVASGADTCILHYNQNNKICKSGELVLLDFGTEYLNYAADVSRTLPISGHFEKFQLKVYNTVLEIQKEAKKLIKPGNTINNWNKQIGLLMEQKLLELGLLKAEDIKNQSPQNPAYKKYYMHGTGHFLGLDVHDVGTNDTLWQPGMILTVEPGIYISQLSLGVRLENDVLVTKDGCEDLCSELPIEPEDIEKIMQFNN